MARSQFSTQGRVVRPLSAWRRGAAALLDVACLSPALVVTAWISLSVLGEVKAQPLLWSGLLFLLIVLLYHLLFLVTLGATPGLRQVGGEVISVFGERPELWRAMWRCLLLLPSVGFFAVGMIWMLGDNQRRALHDWLSGTVVIRRDAAAGDARRQR